MRSRPVLIPYASAGNGHRAAAQALWQAFEEEGLGAIITDVLHFSVPLFRMVYSKTYSIMGEYSHLSCEAMYRLMDRPREESLLIQFIDWLCERHVRPFTGFVEENEIELALCTHFLPSLVLASMRRKGSYAGEIYSVITDYGLHKVWVHEDVDRYFVPHEDIRKTLLALGVAEEKIDITGIPVKREFASANREGERSRELFTVLLSGSAVSDNKVLQILRWLGEMKSSLRVLLVAGRNEGLLERLESYEPPKHMALERFGFVHNMPSLMKEADLMITKPGGLVVTEALCASLPMILVSPIPLQETENALYLEKEGAALYCEHLEDFPFTFRKLSGTPEILESMRKAAARLARPDAAKRILAQVTRGGIPSREN